MLLPEWELILLKFSPCRTVSTKRQAVSVVAEELITAAIPVGSGAQPRFDLSGLIGISLSDLCSSASWDVDMDMQLIGSPVKETDN